MRSMLTRYETLDYFFKSFVEIDQVVIQIV